MSFPFYTHILAVFSIMTVDSGALFFQFDLSNVVHAYDYYVRLYGDDIEDKTSLYTVLTTCAGFKVCPPFLFLSAGSGLHMRTCECRSGFRPDRWGYDPALRGSVP